MPIPDNREQQSVGHGYCCPGRRPREWPSTGRKLAHTVTRRRAASALLRLSVGGIAGLRTWEDPYERDAKRGGPLPADPESPHFVSGIRKTGSRQHERAVPVLGA